ncbi:hypothetical protein K1719_046252 [Acacia pycnantha]|nr:hypothetical protein K1719_046252 [Acacia pycnantha]
MQHRDQPTVASLLGAAEENHKENSNRLYIHPPSQSDDDDKHQRLIDEVIPLFMKCGLLKPVLIHKPSYNSAAQPPF